MYFVRSADKIGLIKIGHCKDVVNRLSVLQTGSGFQLHFMGSIHCQDKKEAVAVEKDLHELFGYCRRKGEWFTPNQPLRDTIALLATGVSWKEARPRVKQAVRKKWRNRKIALRVVQVREEGQVHPKKRELKYLYTWTLKPC